MKTFLITSFIVLWAIPVFVMLYALMVHVIREGLFNKGWKNE